MPELSFICREKNHQRNEIWFKKGFRLIGIILPIDPPISGIWHQMSVIVDHKNMFGNAENLITVNIILSNLFLFLISLFDIGLRSKYAKKVHA